MLNVELGMRGEGNDRSRYHVIIKTTQLQLTVAY